MRDRATRLTLGACALALAAFACTRTAPPAPAPAAPDDDEARVERLIGFERALNAERQAMLPRLRAYRLTLTDSVGASDRATTWYQAQMEAPKQRELVAARLSEGEVKQLAEAARATYTERRAGELLGRGPLRSPPRLAPRPDLQAQPAANPVLRKQQEALAHATIARGRYGDALVDALIHHEAELAPLLDEDYDLGQQIIHTIDHGPPELPDAGP